MADIVDIIRRPDNIKVEWAKDKIELLDYKDSKNAFFVRTSSSKEEVEKSFGKVEFVEGVVEGEMGFITDVMSEGDFIEKSEKINLINRVRLG